ncbi:hypothetical protein PIROE2DRAFT_11466 [Piromyces sp. E2]|nr:hypothetical protein PIROE2DRAFT_11466 [Piromyces sp. E2]|eukprot:OUM62313.1 hypothetical protein PIROE2DRAFT_11466 [Piromyces sp. E2]
MNDFETNINTKRRISENFNDNGLESKRIKLNESNTTKPTIPFSTLLTFSTPLERHYSLTDINLSLSPEELCNLKVRTLNKLSFPQLISLNFVRVTARDNRILNKLISIVSKSLQICNIKTSGGTKKFRIPTLIASCRNLTTLSLDINNKEEIKAFSPKLCNFSYLTNLSFSNNNLETVPEEVFKLSKLCNLNLSHNNLKDLPEDIGNLSYLIELNISYNQIEFLPKGLYKLSKLTILNLKHNYLKILQKEVGNLSKLTKLNLKCNDIMNIPEEIGNLSELTKLNLNIQRNIRTLPRGIGKLTKLTSLKIEYNKIRILPEEICNLINLKELNVSYNAISTLLGIGKLTKLTSLKIQYNKIRILPEEICNLINLKELNVRCNDISTLPERIGNLINLTELNISNNNINILPDSIGELLNLSSLYIDSNEITELPKSLGSLFNISTLYISNNKIESIPEEIGNLLNLIYFEFDKNPLKSIPNKIGNLINLRYIKVCDNLSIKNYFAPNIIPSFSEYSFQRFQRINKLDLSNKNLTQIPVDIMNLRIENELNISDNNLKEIPSILRSTGSLKKIDARNNIKINSINKIPDAILGLPNLESIIISTTYVDGEINGNILVENLEDEGIKILNIDDFGNIVLEYTKKALINVKNQRIQKLEEKVKELCYEINLIPKNLLYIYINKFPLSEKSLQHVININIATRKKFIFKKKIFV